MGSIKNGIFTMKEKHAVCFYTVVAQETGTGNLKCNICTTYYTDHRRILQLFINIYLGF